MMYTRLLSAVFVSTAILSVAPAKAATHTVDVMDFSFDPANVIVNPGDTIEWNWVSGIHTATSGVNCTPDGRFNGPVDPGNTLFSYTVPGNEPPGVIPYYCIPHCLVNMVGTITVEVPLPIPAVSQWGLGIMALLVVAVATATFRRTRAR